MPTDFDLDGNIFILFYLKHNRTHCKTLTGLDFNFSVSQEEPKEGVRW